MTIPPNPHPDQVEVARQVLGDTLVASGLGVDARLLLTRKDGEELMVDWEVAIRAMIEFASLANRAADDGERQALARRLYWAEVKHDDKEGRIPDEWRDHWWQTNVDMPLSGPGFLARWLAIADAALPPQPEGVKR